MEEKIIISDAQKADAADIAGIYAPYAENTAVNFEYTAPDAAEFEKRIEDTKKEFPFLTAKINSDTVGFAYAHKFRARQAYCHCAEVSIYVKSGFWGRKIGSALYSELERILRRQNIYKLYAVIVTDENGTVGKDSIAFHEKSGYTKAALLKNAGYKFGKWYGITIMEKEIADKSVGEKPIINFSEL